jgi:outer membrane protein assembly factor BamB
VQLRIPLLVTWLALGGCGGTALPPLPPTSVAPGKSAQSATGARSETAARPAARPSLDERLAGLDDAEVTATLIDVASDPATPAPEQREARRRLALRRSGAEQMLAALDHHDDLASGRRPPVGALADALAAMEERRAAPLLAHQLNEPSNSPEDVERAARALTTLATPAEVDDLKVFFSLYHATADDEALVRAVVAVAETLLRVGGEPERALVERATSDPLTHPGIRRGLEMLPSPQG